MNNVLWPGICPIVVNVSYELENNIYLVVVKVFCKCQLSPVNLLCCSGHLYSY